MVIKRDISRDVEAAKRLPLSAGRASLPIISFPNLKQLIIYMPEGSKWTEHSTPARITVLVLHGSIRMSLSAQTYDLSAGAVLGLDSGTKHDVEALEESWFLLTVARRTLD